MDLLKVNWLPATDAARAIRDGVIDAEQLARACLSRTRELDAEGRYWASLDADHLVRQARARDLDRREGRALGPLHGIPVAVADTFDTFDMPTEDGSALHAGRTPARDAAVVARLRAAGTVLMGKTRVAEFGAELPRAEGSDADAVHGAPRGAAFAVATGMVQLAVASQSRDGVIRSAASSGVFGFKPTHGLIPRGGLLRLSRTLDQVGVLSRSLEDVALLAETLVDCDARDPDTAPRARPPFVRVAGEEPALLPVLAWLKGPLRQRAGVELPAAFGELTQSLPRVVEIELPESARKALDWHRVILEAEMAASLDRAWDTGRWKLSDAIRVQIARGRRVRALDYQQALARIALLNDGFESIFDRCDAIVTPVPAIQDPDADDPAFCALWTLCGMPAVTVPLLRTDDGRSLGVQLVGRRGDDARLLRTARWLAAHVTRAMEDEA